MIEATQIELIPISASQLAAGVETRVELASRCDSVWVPPSVVVAGKVIQNSSTIQVGIRFNSAGAVMHAMGLESFLASRFIGKVERIYVTLLGGAAAPFYLMAGHGVRVEYAGDMMGAGTPDNATTNGDLAGNGD